MLLRKRGRRSTHKKYMYQFLRTYFLLGGPSRCQDACGQQRYSCGRATASGLCPLSQCGGEWQSAYKSRGRRERRAAVEHAHRSRCLGRHANYLRAHLLPGIPGEFVARDQLRCRSEQPVPCRDEAPRRRPWTARAGRGARAPARQATSRHAPPDACRHPILASKPFLPTAYLVAERTFWYVLAPAEGLGPQKPVANPLFAGVSRINWPPLKV